MNHSSSSLKCNARRATAVSNTGTALKEKPARRLNSSKLFSELSGLLDERAEDLHRLREFFVDDSFRDVFNVVESPLLGEEKM